jgi:hypothetical protein
MLELLLGTFVFGLFIRDYWVQYNITTQQISQCIFEEFFSNLNRVLRFFVEVHVTECKVVVKL